MKKLSINILFVALALIMFTSCVSSKKGCGLTSDAQKIEQSTTENTLAEV